MANSVLQKVDRLLSLEAKAENESEIRELVNEIFARTDELYELTATESDPKKGRRLLSLCLKKLRALNNNRESTLEKCDYCFVELDRLLESVCLCTDILLSDSEVNLSFAPEKVAVSCCPSLIVDSFMNLISNAVKYSRGKNITAALRPEKRQCVISVSDSAGENNTLSLIKPKSGLRSVQNTARLHGGRLLFASNGSSFSAEMAISAELPRGKRYHAPPFSSYLENRFPRCISGCAIVFLSVSSSKKKRQNKKRTAVWQFLCGTPWGNRTLN